MIPVSGEPARSAAPGGTERAGERVTVIIPMRNEERYIARCLDSILANDHPHERLEILVIDGESTDRSLEIVRDYSRRYPFIRALPNPKRLQAPAMNLGIRAARGEVIVRADAHVLYAPDYIRQCVQALRATGAANVGGVQRAEGQGFVGEAIAMATTSRFGIGDAQFRFSEKAQKVDTVYLGAWRKETLEAMGGYNEEWAVNEDYELNYRLRQSGGVVLLEPAIRCRYYVRDSLRALARQYARYGFWKVKTLVAHPNSLRWRQMLPPLLVGALLVSALLLPISPWLGALVPALYAAATLVAAASTACRRGWRYFPLLPLVFATLHLSWGTGFLAGLCRWGVPRVTPRTLRGAIQPLDEG